MRITLKNDEITAGLDTLGGAMESLRDASTGEEHCWQYDAALWPRRTSVCFPVCGALPGDGYAHGGARYDMPMHGFLRQCVMEAASVEERNAVLTLESNGWTREWYPFDFRLEVAYGLEGRSLTVEYRVSNTGPDVLPFSIGSHYTYALPAAQKECWLAFSGGQHAGRLLAENGEIVSKSDDVFHGAERLSMEGLFDGGSYIFDMNDLQTDYIAIGTGETMFTRVECGGVPYVVLWAPKGGNSPFVCIEPWAGMIGFTGPGGELFQKRGIQTLNTGEVRAFRQRIVI